MFSMIRQLFCATSRFVRREDGATSVEYAVMLALIIAAVLGSLRLVGNQAALSFTRSATELSSAFGP